MPEIQVLFLDWEDNLEKGQAAHQGFPGDLDGKESACNVETWVQSLGWEDLLEEGMATHSSILAQKIPKDREAWWVTVHGVTNSWT